MFCARATGKNVVLVTPVEDVHFISTDVFNTVAVHDAQNNCDTSKAQTVAYTVYERGGTTVMACKLPPVGGYSVHHAESIACTTLEKYLSSNPNAYMRYSCAGTVVRQSPVGGLTFPKPHDYVVLRVQPVSLCAIRQGQEVIAFTEALIEGAYKGALGLYPEVLGQQVTGLAKVIANIASIGGFFDALHCCEYNVALGLATMLPPSSASAVLLFSALAHSAPVAYLQGMRTFEDGTPVSVRHWPQGIIGSAGDARVCCKVNDRFISVRPECVRITSPDSEAADPVPRLNYMIGICAKAATLRKVAEDNHREGAFPDDFRCPITTVVMRDPVVAADGHTYEREAIATWLAKHHTSPLTREVISFTAALIPNRNLVSLMGSWTPKL